MRAPLSIIIPTLDAEPRLPETVSALFEGLDTGLVRELVVSDAGLSDGIAALADKLGATLVTGAPGRGQQLHHGALAAKGDWLLFLHADTILDAGWSKTVLHHIADHPERAGYFRLQFDVPGMAPRIVAGWSNVRSRVFRLPYGDQGLLISRRLYGQSGGYEPIALMEDVAMARRLRGRLTPLNCMARTSAAKYQRDGWWRRSMRNFRTLLLYKMGVPPHRLVAQYERKLRSKL